MTHNDKKIYVIPKVGYEHYINVEGSLTTVYGQLDSKEVDFWYETAKDEYLYKTDRKKTYTVDSE
jgi:hypothetical protein